MKTSHKILKTILLISVMALSTVQFIYAQDTSANKIDAQNTTIKNLLDSQHYVFVAQSVTPMSGRLRQLTTYYFLKVTKDTVISDLPYFGKAYVAPLNPSEAGFNFTSTNFEYAITPGKKDDWNVLIRPKDGNDVREFTLNIFSNGTAYLRVSSNNRQPISYNGFIKAAGQQ